MSGNSTCTSCGGTLAGNARFCPTCGSEQSVSSGPAETLVTPSTLATHCPACSSPVSASNSFCPSCGGSLQEAATVASQGSIERITTDRLTEATTGEFEVLQRIGHGAMGSVYLARDVALSRRVAIKVISPHLLQDETMVARFRLEAQTVAALRHPNIVNLHAVRQLGDLHYFIMDYIDGPSLRAVMKAHAPLDIPAAQALLFQVGSALSYAHRRGRGVIHRDVKPANVMVDREGNAVVMDFGISKVGAAQSGLTQTGATIGTPEYMSPEQCTDKELSGASDQYALGIVAYEMLTGSVPFKGSTYAIMMAHAQGTPPSIREQRPDCSHQIEAAVLRMLAKSPEERFPDLQDAVAAMGGQPLGHRDPVRDAIVALVESVSSDETGLDESSPLSPVPGSRSADSITITGLPEIIEPGDSFRLDVESRRRPGSTLPPSEVQWMTSDPSVATVDSGTVAAHAPGSASLTATAGPVANTVLLTVAELPAVQVSIQPRTVTIQEGGAIPLRVVALDRDGRVVQRAANWMSRNPKGASVSPDGVVTAVSSGTTRIDVEVDGVSASAEIAVEVASGVAANAKAAAAAATVAMSDVSAVSAGPRPAREGRSRNRAWIGVAAVVVVALGVAQAARTRGGSATTATAVRLTSVADTMLAGDTLALAATIEANGGPLSPSAGAWTSSDPTVASVDGGGVVIARSAGVVSITLLYDDARDSTRVVVQSGEVVASGDPSATVDPAGTSDPGVTEAAPTRPSQPAPGDTGEPLSTSVGTPEPGRSSRPAPPVEPVPTAVASVRIVGGSPALLEGAAVPISATGLAQDGTPVTGVDVEWSSSDESAAAVRGDRLVGVRAGVATVTATVGGGSGSTQVSVLALPVREDVVALLQERVVRVISDRDADGVERLLGRGGRAQRPTQLLSALREQNLRAQLDSLGDVTPRGNAAFVDFRVALAWRARGGERAERAEMFRALMQPTADGWRLEGVSRRQR